MKENIIQSYRVQFGHISTYKKNTVFKYTHNLENLVERIWKMLENFIDLRHNL